MKNKYFYFIFLLTISNKVLAEYDPTNDLFYAFGSRCQGNGSINALSHQDAQSIKQMTITIRDDVDCKGIASALDDIDQLNISQLLKSNEASLDVESLSMQASDLEKAIAFESSNQSPDLNYVDELKSELIKTKVLLAKSKKNPATENTQRRYETIQNFQKYSTNLFSQLKISDRCLTKRPNLAAQVGAQILGLSSTLTSGLVGSLLLSSGSLVDNFISFFREKSLGRKIKNINNMRLGEAVACSYEGLAYTYCQARDIETIIKFNSKQNLPPTSQNEKWLDGVGLIGQDSRAYMDWITKVDAGSAAGTVGRALDKKEAFQKQNELRLIKTDVEGLLATLKRSVSLASNKVQATKAALNALAAKFSAAPGYNQDGSPKEGLFSSLFSQDKSCGSLIYFYSKGKDRVKKASTPSISCEDYVNQNYTVLPDINNEVSGLIDALVAETTEEVNNNLSQVNESNPQLILSKLDSKNSNGRSARQFLISSSNYLSSLLNDKTSISKNKNQHDLIDKTKKQIDKTIEIIEKSEIPVDPAQPNGPQKTFEPTEKLALISTELVPQGDTFAIPKSLEEIISQDIDDKLSKGLIDENLSALMQFSSSNSLGELVKYYIGLDPARAQASKAKQLSKVNLSSMGSLFGENFQTYLEKLSREASTDEDAKDSLALACLQSLAVPESPRMGKSDVSKFCKGSKYKSIYEGSKISLSYDDLVDKDYAVRTCAVYDFYRTSFVFGQKTQRGLQKNTSTRQIK